MSDTEQNKTEDATPFKLRKAREKGQVAKGSDIAFFGTLVALCLYSLFAGQGAFEQIMTSMRNLYVQTISAAADSPEVGLSAIREVYGPGIWLLAGLGACVLSLVIVLQILQLRGLLFTAHPLKPDFNRINPAKGLKRLFSFQMLKEALKNIFKMIVYCTAATLVCFHAVRVLSPTVTDGQKLISAIHSSGLRLLFAFTLIAMIFAVIDQIIVHQEFRKQMKMSMSELKREHKDREGEPRIKQKRKQLHKEFAKQTSDLGNLPGSDLLIVNPTHFAVGLKYDVEKMAAPIISTKGRNRYAAMLRVRSNSLGIPIFHNPQLARSLYRMGSSGQSVPEELFRDVAKAYIFIRTRQQRSSGE